MKNTDFLFKIKIVHRGIYDNINIPENTIPAFQKAIENGYGFELDVHILKDNNVVVFHDAALKRAAGIDRKIRDYTYEELRKIHIFKTQYHIPLLQEVLQLVKGRVSLLIELKYDTMRGRLEKEVCNLLDKYQGNFIVHSFNPLSIWRIKKWKPEWIRGQLLGNDIKKYRLIFSMLIQNHFTDPDIVLPELQLLLDKKIQKICQKKIVIGWIAKNEEEYEKYRKYCDNMIIHRE